MMVNKQELAICNNPSQIALSDFNVKKLIIDYLSEDGILLRMKQHNFYPTYYGNFSFLIPRMHYFHFLFPLILPNLNQR